MPHRASAPSSDDQTTLTIRLPKELAAAFDMACAQADRTRSQIMRDLIRSWLDGKRSPRLPL